MVKDGGVPGEVTAAANEIATLSSGLREHFRRGAAHRHAAAYVEGLLGELERKNGWQLAEYGGYQHPRTIQRVLDRSVWDADAVRDDLRDQVIEALGDEDGVLVDGWVHALVIRRSIPDPDELAYYPVYAPTDTPLTAVVLALGARWTIEEVFKLAKQRVGLDEYEARFWTGWHRHMTLALLALAALVLGAAKGGTHNPPIRTTSSCPSASPRCIAF